MFVCAYGAGLSEHRQRRSCACLTRVLDHGNGIELEMTDVDVPRVYRVRKREKTSESEKD